MNISHCRHVDILLLQIAYPNKLALFSLNCNTPVLQFHTFDMLLLLHVRNEARYTRQAVYVSVELSDPHCSLDSCQVI